MTESGVNSKIWSRSDGEPPGARMHLLLQALLEYMIKGQGSVVHHSFSQAGPEVSALLGRPSAVDSSPALAEDRLKLQGVLPQALLLPYPGGFVPADIAILLHNLYARMQLPFFLVLYQQLILASSSSALDPSIGSKSTTVLAAVQGDPGLRPSGHHCRNSGYGRAF